MAARQLALAGIETTKEDSASRVAKEVFALILHARGENANFRLTEAALVEALRPALKKEFPKGKPTRIINGRDPLFDAIAIACDMDLKYPMTRGQGNTIGIARRDINEAVAGVSADEILRRARLYVAKYRLPHCTPTGLAKHFCEFSPKGPEEVKPDIYTEPIDWRERVAKLDFSPESIAQLVTQEWRELPISIRQQLAR